AEHTVEFYSTDAAGNGEAAQTAVVRFGQRGSQRHSRRHETDPDTGEPILDCEENPDCDVENSKIIEKKPVEIKKRYEEIKKKLPEIKKSEIKAIKKKVRLKKNDLKGRNTSKKIPLKPSLKNSD
ncbi:hypothetical protein HZA43_05335, partial [Candidatus Peregrinibacteria bacterium]|nr:hypothetical protein [Candidatus Peregrinibacteria bacterium]